MQLAVRVLREAMFPMTIVVSGVLLCIISFHSYLLFHSLVELFTVVVAFGIFSIAWSSRRYIDNNFLLIIGIGYFFIGGTDLFHTLGYQGMQIFQNTDANQPTQLWVIARYLEALTFIGALFFFRKKSEHSDKEFSKKAKIIFLMYAAISACLTLSVVYWNNFPRAYVDGVGLTDFKKQSEYVIIFLFLTAVVMLFKKKSLFESEMFNLLSLSLILKVIVEIFFTGYAGVYDFSNVLGHLFKFMSFLLLYKAILEIGLMKPYHFLFLDLKKSQEEYRVAQYTLQQRIEENLSKAYEELAITNRKISLLLDIDAHGWTRGKKNNEKIIEYILSLAKGVSSAKMVLLYKRAGKNSYTLVSEIGAGKGKRGKLKYISSIDASFVEKLAKEKKRINAPCRLVDPGCFDWEKVLRYFVVLPLRQGNAFGGFLFLGYEKRESMDTRELEFLDIFSFHASSALSRMKIIEFKG